MKLAKWGNSLAIRIPVEVVEQLGIGPNEEVEIKVTGENSFEVTRDRRRQDALRRCASWQCRFRPGTNSIVKRFTIALTAACLDDH